MPPFESMQFPLASCETQAAPVQVAAHGVAPQLSSADSPHGFGPGSVDVPEVSASLMSSVAALIDPAPTAPMRSQTGFVLASHPERQTFSDARGSTGKLCEMPVHPLSRSVPLSAVARSASSGPPWGFTQGIVVVVVPPGGGGGLHLSTSLSVSTFGLPLLFATTWRIFIPGWFFFLPLSGTVMLAFAPHVAPVRSAGGGRMPVGLTLIVVSGGIGVQPETSVWLTQSATVNTHAPFAAPSESQLLSPSVHLTTVRVIAPPWTSNSL